MAVNPVIAQMIANPRTPDIVGAFQQGKEMARAQRARQLAGGILQSQFGQGQLGQLAQEDPQIALQLGQALGIPTDQPGRIKRFADNANTTLAMVDAGDLQGALSFMQEEKALLNDLGIETPRIDEGIQQLQQDPEGFKTQLTSIVNSFQQTGVLERPKDTRTAAEREFEELTKGMSDEDIAKARRIKAGLDPRAVGSASQTIAQEGTEEEIARVEGAIAQGKKFGEMTGASRAKAIDAGFEKVQKLSKNIENLGNAVEAVRAGAGTGALARRFPSIRNSSILLDQIQGELALDVVGAVTFGALSEGELDLAKQVALPTGLEGEELIKWLQDKQAAQQKLLDYFQEQINFLDQGGTIAGFLRSKRRDTATPQALGGATPPTTGQIKFLGFE